MGLELHRIQLDVFDHLGNILCDGQQLHQLHGVAQVPGAQRIRCVCLDRRSDARDLGCSAKLLPLDGFPEINSGVDRDDCHHYQPEGKTR